MIPVRLSVAALALSASTAALAEPRVFDIDIKDHHFAPAQITIPAGEKVKLRVHNRDTTPEEFESYTLNREKVIAGNSRAIIFVGPLEAGSYPFFGEFNQATAQGRLIVK